MRPRCREIVLEHCQGAFGNVYVHKKLVVAGGFCKDLRILQTGGGVAELAEVVVRDSLRNLSANSDIGGDVSRKLRVEECKCILALSLPNKHFGF